MAKQKQGRVIMRIDITPKAVESLAASADARGMTQIATTSRIIEWFTRQSDEVQATILGNHPAQPTPDELARMIVAEMKQ